MTDNSTIHLFGSFQEEVQNSSEINEMSSPLDNDLKKKGLPDFLYDATCSNCHKEFTTYSFKIKSPRSNL